MNINSKKELKNRNFVCRRILKGNAIEDIPKMREYLQSLVDKNEGAVMTETDRAFNFNNGQFVLKPTLPRQKLAKLECGSTYARFDGMRIEYTDIHNVFACSFETETAEYSIKSELFE